jgi:hypothetical protein
MGSEVMCATAKEVVAHSSLVTAVRKDSSGILVSAALLIFFHPAQW